MGSGIFSSEKVVAQALTPDCAAVLDVNVSPTTLARSDNTANISISVTPTGANGACMDGATTRTDLMLFVGDGKGTISTDSLKPGLPYSRTFTFKPSESHWDAGQTVPIIVKVSIDASHNLANPTSRDLATRTVTISIDSVAQQAQTNVPATNLTPTQSQTTTTDRADLGALINGCVNETNGEAYLNSDCGNVTIFLDLMLRVVNYLFGIIGGVALMFFVYGGFMFILSSGNAERVEKGKGIILAAVLGIVIAFSGYALVKFVGDSVGLESTYKLQ